MEMVRNFLFSPNENREEFWENDELIWIDWREYEESIIKYFNEKLPPEDQIKFECKESEKEREIDIVLEKNGVKIEIPYADEYTDRDTTLRNIEKYIEPKYQIRWYMDSLGSDTLAFYIGLTFDWKLLEEEFGKEKVDFYFKPIDEESIMFEMDINEVFDLIEKREKRVLGLEGM